MRTALLLALIASSALADGRVYNRNCDIASRRSDRGGVSCSTAVVDAGYVPAFAFAPASGTGMSAACACTAVTGSKGEVVTFTRATAGTCTKSNTVSGIANGELVACASGEMRVMPGGDGTGGLGIDISRQRTNALIRNQEFDNASWIKEDAVAAGVPVVVADQATAPDGTLTADQVTIPATNALQYSLLIQDGCQTGTTASSVFVKGNGTSGTFDLCVNTGTYGCTACTYNSSTWTRCRRQVLDLRASSAPVLIGNASLLNSGTTRSAHDFFLWGAQCELGTTPSVAVSPYIPTVSTTVQRNAEVVIVATGSISGDRCWGATVVTDAILPGDNTWLMSADDGTTGAANRYGAQVSGGKLSCFFRVGSASVSVLSVTSFTASASNRFVCKTDGVNGTPCVNGVCDTPTFIDLSPMETSTRIHIGSDYLGTTTTIAPGTYKNVVVDNTLEGCSP